MHIWGDEWFDKHGDNLYAAIGYIEKNLRKNGIEAIGKEKYGTYRSEITGFWDGGIYQLLFGYRICIGPFRPSRIKWLNSLQVFFHKFIYWVIDNGWTVKMITTKDNLEMIKERFTDENGNFIERGFKSWMRKTAFYKRFTEKKKDTYNRVFQEACKKWPDVIDELIVDTDWYYLIEPGKYGNVSGKAIHDKYYEKLESYNA